MTARTAWIGCAAAGVAAFVCSWFFGRIPGLVACGPTGGLGPVIAFEFVRSPADVAALFGSEPCRATFVAAQKTGLLLDGLGFIPAYSAFLIFAIAALAGGGWAKWVGIAVVAAAGLLDEIEGGLLRHVLDGLPGDQATIGLLGGVVHAKFALLAAGTLWIAVLLLTPFRWHAMLASLAVGLGALTAAAGLLSGPSPVMMTGFAIGWLSLLLAALLGVWRPSLFSPQVFLGAHAAPPRVRETPSA